jgi:TonB family protein
MNVWTRTVAAAGAGVMNALLACLWQLAWPWPAPAHAAGCMDCDGGFYFNLVDTGLFIEARAGVGRAGGGAGAPDGTGERKSCHPTEAIDHDPYVVEFGPRPLQLHTYARQLTLCVEIGAGGTVERAFVLASSGRTGTDRDVIASLRAMRFSPALRHGRPVASWHRMVVGHMLPPPPPLAADEDHSRQHQADAREARRADADPGQPEGARRIQV